MLTDFATIATRPVREQLYDTLSHVYNLNNSFVFILFHYSVKISAGLIANRGGTYD
jgi:hypothetical protein